MPGGATHNRVFAGVVAGLTPENADGNLLFSKIVRVVVERSRTNELQHGAQARAFGETTAAEQALQLLAALPRVDARSFLVYFT
jgi:hypothetical protein